MPSTSVKKAIVKLLNCLRYPETLLKRGLATNCVSHLTPEKVKKQKSNPSYEKLLHAVLVMLFVSKKFSKKSMALMLLTARLPGVFKILNFVGPLKGWESIALNPVLKCNTTPLPIGSYVEEKRLKLSVLL